MDLAGRTAGTDPGSPSDSELLTALIGGDRRWAWSILVARYSPKMYAVARSFRLNEQTAEDLVQTAWLRLIERVGQLRDPDAVGPWLCMIVRNEARRLVTRQREIPSVLILEHRPNSDALDTALLNAERAGVLRAALATLGSQCQQLLRLLIAEPPLSYDEIAAALGRPRGSLGPTRRRCLDQLRLALPTDLEP